MYSIMKAYSSSISIQISELVRFYNIEQIPISIQFFTNIFLTVGIFLTLSSKLNAFCTFGTLILYNLSSENIFKIFPLFFHFKFLSKRKKMTF